VESRHVGSLVTLGPDGRVRHRVGSPEVPIFPRSANKPLQAVGMLRAGLRPSAPQAGPELAGPELAGPDLALIAASHSGEQVHLPRVRALLAAAGLDESALRCPSDLPLSAAATRTLLRAGGDRERVYMNCSGKHAGMLATCRAAGWPTEGYLEPGHPLQQSLLATVQDLAGEQVPAVGVDGCGAPLFALSLLGLARAFTRLVLAPPGTPERRVADAMRAHPELVGGSDRDVTALMRAVPGLLAKDGAEGVYAAAMPVAGGAVAVALKVDDGAARARVPALVAALQRLGVDIPALAELAELPVLGGGVPVGAVRAAW